MKFTNLLFVLCTCVLSLSSYAQNEDEGTGAFETSELSENTIEELLVYQKYSDSIESTFSYQRGGVVELGDGIAEIRVPEGYKFLDKKQAQRVLSELWGNPPSDDGLGMLLIESETPVTNTYAVEISYTKDGYVDDDDADDIDYDDLLEEMQDDIEQVNPERKKLGYSTVELLGWASPPFYDGETKKLHWAKELLFEGEEASTLNYNIRILGRKGYINLNAIGTMEDLPAVQKDLDPILASVSFKEGSTYADFDADLDEVAAYGIGGLIAGKILAKVGFLAVILKFWKIGALALVGVFSAFKKRIFGGGDKEA